jgi:putative SOS response-associated peptidase YedK
MCGRFALTSNASTLNTQFDTNVFVTLTPRFNIAPSQKILAIRTRSHHQRHESILFKWGLIPSWAKDQSIGTRLTNARSETALTKPSFRDSFRRRRCLIPATGFYEWTTSGKRKQPYHVRLISNEPFGIGGLWDSWEDSGKIEETCTILTCDANQAMQHLHPRMPVVIQPERYDAWLDPATELKDLSQDLLPFPEETTAISTVSDYVNDVRHDDVRCQQQFSDSNQAHPMHNAQLPVASQKRLFEK